MVFDYQLSASDNMGVQVSAYLSVLKHYKLDFKILILYCDKFYISETAICDSVPKYSAYQIIMNLST